MGEIKKSIPCIDPDVTINIFKKFADVNEIDEKVAETIMLSGDAFWEFMIKGWEAYASHAGRQHLEKSDIQLHMLRTGLAKNYNEFSNLITSYLPQHLTVDVLEIARAQNIVEKHRKKQNAKSVSPKTKNLETTITPMRQTTARRRLFSDSALDCVPNPVCFEEFCELES